MKMVLDKVQIVSIIVAVGKYAHYYIHISAYTHTERGLIMNSLQPIQGNSIATQQTIGA